MLNLRDVFVWSASLAMLLSLSLGTFLAVRCLLYLRRAQRKIGDRRDLVKHIGAIAAADASMAAWSYFASAIHSKSLLVQGDPEWCTLFTTVRMWLILLSALWTAALAMATLAALLGKQRHVKLIRYTALGVLPLSCVMCAYNFWEPYVLVHTFDGNADCEQEMPTASLIQCIEQSVIFLFILGVLAFSLIRTWRLPSTSPDRRSIHVVSRYLVAYTASYGLWIIALIPFPSHVYEYEWMQMFVSAAWRLLNLNGTFNFVALWLHARDSARELHLAPLNVHILTEAPASVVEVPQVDYKRLCRRNKADLAEVQNANQRLWRELGLTYEQGVSGQMEPLSEEERASHFYSILQFECSSKLQQARID